MSVINRLSRNRKKSLFNRFFRNDDGVVALEFAIVAPAFFLVIIGTLETAIVFLASMALDHGMQRTARFVQTGQAADVSLSESGFKKMVCDAAVMMPDCTNNIKVDVRKFDKFTSATFPSMIKPNGDLKDDADYEYDIGQPESTVVVRVLFEWPVLTSFFSGSFDEGNGKKRLISSWAFKNEPF